MNCWEEGVSVKKEELGNFLYYIVKSKNRSQKVCCVSTESDLKTKLKHWEIKPGLVFSFPTNISPNVKPLLSETVPSTGVAIIVEEPSKNNVFIKVVKDIEIESGLIQPTTIGLVSRTKVNDLYKELRNGESIKLSKGWRTLLECTHLVFVQNPYKRESAFSCLSETIAKGKNEGKTNGANGAKANDVPVVIFADTECMDIVSDEPYANRHIVVDVNKLLMLYPFDRQTMHHKIRQFSNSAQDFRDCLVQSLVETIPQVSAEEVLDLAVDMKANVDIGEFMDTFKYKRKRHVVANAFRNDIWPQIKTLITSQKQKSAFYERLLLSLHGKKKTDKKKSTFYERLLLFLHGKKNTDEVKSTFYERLLLLFLHAKENTDEEKPTFYERLQLFLHGKENTEEQKPTVYERLLLFLHAKENTEEQTHEDLLKEIAKCYSDKSDVEIILSSTSTQQKMNNTILCLFLWAILHQRFNVAQELWMQTKNMMAAALLAYKILKKMKIDKTYAVDERVDIENTIVFYRDHANEILTECLKVNKDYTKKNLVRKRDEFGGKSLLQIAEYNKSFMAHDACHSKMNDIWFSPLEIESERPPIWLILMCVFLPFLAPLLIPFRKEIAVEKNKNKCQPLVAYGKTIFGFLNAPVVKFIYYLLAFLIFLASFGYDLIFDVSELTWNDGIVIAFVVSFTTEEIRQMYIKKKKYIRNVWDCVDISSLVLFISGQSLTNTTFYSEGGRVLLAISFIGFCIRLLQVFASLSQIGPFLIMIARMLVDTVYFLGVLIVVVISYAVSSRAVLYPNTAFTWPSLYTTFRKPYWHIFGELFLDELEGDAECEAIGTLSNRTAFCPSTMARYVIPVMLGVYMIIVQLLLINLLIAKFSNTFDTVHENIEKHWRLLHSELIKEYYDRTMIFPPFTSIYHVFIFIRFVYAYLCASSTNGHMEKKSWHSDSYCITLQQRENINLQTWEHKRAKTVFLQKRRNSCQTSIDNSLGIIYSSSWFSWSRSLVKNNNQSMAVQISPDA